jgi:hypothetical protein
MELDSLTLTDIALRHLPLAGFHHLLIAVLAVMWWLRREEVGRFLSAYMALAFATTAVALRSHPAWWLAGGLVSGVLAMAWLREAIRPRFRMSFERTPRLRLSLMVVAAGFAVAYPGHSGDLPVFIFSPLGVTVRPTLLLALAVLNSVTPTADPTLRWTHAVAGVCYGIAGVVSAFPLGPASVVASLVLVLTSCYALALLIVGAREIDPGDAPGATSIQQLRTRMYQRHTFLPGPRDPRQRIRKPRRRP